MIYEKGGTEENNILYPEKCVPQRGSMNTCSATQNAQFQTL